MLLDVQWDGSEIPFEGDRSVPVGGIPVGARVMTARVTVTPVDPGGSFVELISFASGGQRWGANKAQGASFVEVDFRARRTLAAVTGANLAGANLQIDPGGTYVEINDRGAFRTPGDTLFSFPAGARHLLPSFVAARLKITKDPPVPDLVEVEIRSVPENVSLRLGDEPVFHTFLGPLTEAQTSVDFATLLNEFLQTARIVNGFYDVPIVVHADSIARLKVQIVLDLLHEHRPLADASGESVLEYALDAVPLGAITSFTLPIALGSEAVAGHTAVRLQGAFEDTRIALGPLVPDPSELHADITAEEQASARPVARRQEVESLRPQAQAQPFSIPNGSSLNITAVDLLLAPVTAAAQVQVDIREDLGGKPGLVSLLAAPLKVDLHRDPAAEPHWVTATLPAELHLPAGSSFWLVVQRSLGDVTWSAQPAAAGPGLQYTRDGGLSWRKSESGAVPLIDGLFRLRHVPPAFTMPIHVFVGEGADRREVPLRQYEPLGRVDFVLDSQEFADTINTVLAEVAVRQCQPVEHLADGGFEEWLRVGETASASRLVTPVEDIVGSGAIALSPDALTLYTAMPQFADDRSSIAVRRIDAFCLDELGATVLSPPQPLSSTTDFNTSLAASSSGAYLFVAAGSHIWMLDARTLSEIGRFDATLRVLALASGGGRLFAALQQTTPVIFEYDEQALEQALLTNQLPVRTSFGTLSRSVSHLAVTRDGSEVATLSRGSSTTPAGVTFWNPGATERRHVEVPDASGLALSPNGARAFVSRSADQPIAVVDVRLGTVSDGPVPVVDQPFELVTAASSGDRIALRGEMPGVSLIFEIIDLGTPTPAQWTVTDGIFTPVCAGDPFHIAGRLGRVDPKVASPLSSISQVTPVTPGCEYEFSFRAGATAEGAVGEVIWRGERCASAGLVRMPIRPVEGLDDVPERALPLRVHRVRAAAPDGVSQAEVRFRTTPGVIADLDQASLKPVEGPVVNGDLAVAGPEGLPQGWLLDPPDAALTFADGTVHNSGLATATLYQQVPVIAERAFEVEFTGQASHLASAPEVALHWADADADPIHLPLQEGAPPRRVAAGTVPPGASSAELSLALPGNSAVTIERFVFRTTVGVELPISVYAEAPGRLTVSSFRVVTDAAPARPPSPPPTGLCPPTRPGNDPDCEEKDAQYCVSCGADRPMQTRVRQAVVSGRPAQVSACAACGAVHVARGGQATMRARAVAIPRFAIRGPREAPRARAVPVRRVAPSHRAVHGIPRPASVAPAAVPMARPLASFRALSGAERDALTAAGIDTPALVAKLDPEALATLLPSRSASRARMLIGLAKKHGTT